MRNLYKVTLYCITGLGNLQTSYCKLEVHSLERYES